MHQEDWTHERLISPDVTAMDLGQPPADDALSIAFKALGSSRGVEIGLWEAGPGTDVDVEVDEYFVVLGGRGRVQFADGSVIELAPGVLVELRAGDETTWTITERLRKLYVLLPTD